jgi:light-harvesting complex I chlorophyll a/b binding protein 1
MFISEFSSMIRGWESPTVKLFSLKENYQPGDFGLTFGVNEETMGNKMDKELNNGRLAMIGILGMMVQELVTQQQLF